MNAGPVSGRKTGLASVGKDRRGCRVADGHRLTSSVSPPSCIESEQYVIGGLMLANSAWFNVSGIVSAEDFYTHDHRVIFDAIRRMLSEGKPVDFVSLTGFLRDEKALDNAGGYSYIGTLAADTPSAANIEHHAKRVRELSMRRQLIALGQEIAALAYEGTDSETITAQCSAGIERMLATRAGASKRFVEALDDAEATIATNRAKRIAGGVIGAPTGLPSLDHVIGGFTGPRLIIVGGRPGTGKTAFLNQFGVNASHRGHAGFIDSIEMGTDELMIRSMALAAGVNVTRLMRGFEDEAQRGFDAAAGLGDLPLWIDTETSTIEAICAQVAMHKMRHGIKWAAIDHIGLIRSQQKFNNRNDLLGHISWELKSLAKRLNIPVVVLSQLSRKGEEEGRLPRPDDLRDSGNIEQDADIIIMLHTPREEAEKPQRPIKIGVVKNRAGPKCWLAADFVFDAPTQTFREICSEVRA